MDWHHSRSVTKPNKFLAQKRLWPWCFGIETVCHTTHQLHAKKTDHKYVAYCQTLPQLHYAIQNNCHGLLSNRIMLLHLNTHPHSAVLMKELLQQFKWKDCEYLSYNLNLTMSDYHLFSKLKDFFGGKYMEMTMDRERALVTVSTTWQQ